MEPLITAEDVALFQAQAVAEMDDFCRITIPDPDAPKPVMDEDTLQYPPVPRLELYGPDTEPRRGLCRFQIKADINSNVVETTAGERESTYTTSQLQLPVSGINIPPDAVVECLSSRFNPSLPGRVFNIQGEIGHKSKPVVRRFRLREVVA